MWTVGTPPEPDIPQRLPREEPASPILSRDKSPIITIITITATSPLGFVSGVEAGVRSTLPAARVHCQMIPVVCTPAGAQIPSGRHNSTLDTIHIHKPRQLPTGATAIWKRAHPNLPCIHLHPQPKKGCNIPARRKPSRHCNAVLKNLWRSVRSSQCQKLPRHQHLPMMP